MFMTRSNVLDCVSKIKLKNTEGYDRIPQRILVEGRDLPLTELFRLIYRDKTVPGQWLISKVVPVHKKGDKNMVENYRPVANLCSVSKIFEKLILIRISELESINKISIGGKQQHGFTKNKSTATAGLMLQSLIARALDDNCYVAMAGIDLSAAFDVVDVKLLIKRLVILGLPDDMVQLIRVWLKERFFYVCVNGSESTVKVTWYGIVQGSVLGPVLYAIFISPLFDVENLSCFADDKFPLVWNSDKTALIKELEIKLTRIMNWLKDSGMKVNESKTDLCLFHRGDTQPISIKLYGKEIKSNKVMNILGVIFDSKLQWTEHVAHAIKKSMKSLNAIRLIRKYFNQKELLELITSNFYSIMYYNSEIWHLPSLKGPLKQKLLSASAKALKVGLKFFNNEMSFVNIHRMGKRATPNELMLYKLALCLYKLYNQDFNSIEFASLNFNQVIMRRQVNFKIVKSNTNKIGINCLSNRLHWLNDTIPFTWLNSSFDTFKVKCKKLLFKY